METVYRGGPFDGIIVCRNFYGLDYVAELARMRIDDCFYPWNEYKYHKEDGQLIAEWQPSAKDNKK